MPASAKRVVLVTGHYDSRNSDTLDAKASRREPTTMPAERPSAWNAPACFSKLKFPGTIIFLAVAGEEQGLNGSQPLCEDG